VQIKDPIIFVVGAGIGGAISWFFTKRYFEKLKEEEVQSVIASFSKLEEDNRERAEKAKNKPDLSKYVDVLNKSQEQDENGSKAIESENGNTNYSNFTDSEQEIKEEEDYRSVSKPVESNPDRSKPYLLKKSPIDGEPPYFTHITIDYYMDGTYADSHGTEMEVEDYIGKDLMDYVEKTEKDEIFIRNEPLEIDIDIVKQAMTYDEVMFG